MSPVIEKLFRHPESYLFRPLKKELERIKDSPDLTGIVSVENETTSPITPAEHDLSLRFGVQRLQQKELEEAKEIENILPFEKLFNEKILQKYKAIIEIIEGKTKTSANHPKREFIDIEDETLITEVEGWTEELIKNLETNPNEVEELKALVWFHFDAIVNTLNAKSFEKDINEFFESSNYYKSEIEDQIQIRSELLKDLAARYPLKKDELEILTDFITSAKDKDGLVKTMIKLWNQYDLGKNKGTMAKIMFNYFLSRSIQNIAPFFFQYGVALPTVGLLTGNGIAAYFELIGELNEAKLMNIVRSEINKRISQSLIFNKYSFTQDRSLGEIIATLDRGKGSIITLLSESMSLIFPKSVGIASACVGITLINPILSLINLSSIPLTFLTSKIYNRKISPIHKDEIKAKESVANELTSVQDGIKTILTSPHTPQIERSVQEKMDKLDKLTLQRILYQTKLIYAAYFTFSTTQIISSLGALLLYSMEKIPQGAVIANAVYSEGISDPSKEIIDKLCTQFPRHLENIKRMEEILGESDNLDLPDGEEEKRRIPVSRLNNFNIAIRELQFKNILDGINLNINEGDFITVAGPSGIGKSTLLKNIAGLHQPESGSIKIGGSNGIDGINTTDIKKYGAESIYAVMSYSNQEPDIFSEMTLRENIEFYSEPLGDKYLEDLLDALYLNKFKTRLGEKINHFSGGEQVRVGLARALYTKPKILLLDEPTRGLDSASALEVKNILEKIHREGTTIICVTHDDELIKYSSYLEKQGRNGKTINLSKISQG